MTTTFLNPVVIVRVNGVPRRSLSGSTSAGFRAAFSTATIALDPTEDAVEPGDAIMVELGYAEGVTRLVFWGEADDDTRDYWPGGKGIKATGFLARTQRATGVPGPYEADPDSGEIPAFRFVNQTDAAIVAAIVTGGYGLSAVGVRGDAYFTETFGNIEPVTIGKDVAPWTLIEELDRLTFMRTTDTPDGGVRRLPVNGIPASAAVTLTEGFSIVAGTRARTRQGIVNRVTMTGLADAGGPGATPYAERYADSPYIPTPPQYQSEAWQSNLAESAERCDAYATRRVSQMNRLQETVAVEVAPARPDIQAGMGLALAAPHLGYTGGILFWVEQVEHSWDARGIATHLGLLGTSTVDGLNPNEAPIAVIAIRIEQETLGDGSVVWVVYADGSGSYDPDGTGIDLDPQRGIVTYLWAGSPHGPATPAGLPRATFVYTADPTGATITLTVADAHLMHGSATVTVGPAQVRRAVTRVLWGAATTELYLTIDGGATWVPVGVAAVGVCAVGAPTYQLAWDAAGALHRITLAPDGSFVATAVLSGHGVTAAWIVIGNDGLPTHRCWAGCADGGVWFSPDDGQTWARVGTIAAGAVRHIEESPLANGDCWAIAGPSIVHSFDRGATWAVARSYPDAAVAAARFASGRYNDLTVPRSYHWAGFAGTSGNTASRILEAEDQDAIGLPTAALPARVTGLTLGLASPAMFVADIAPDGTTGRIWTTDDLTAGGNLVAGAYDTPGLGLPRHLIRDGFFDGIVYGAADGAFFKTYDRFASVKALKALTAPEVGAMIGYGPLKPIAAVPAASLIMSASLGHAIARTANSAAILRYRGSTWTRLCDHPFPDSAKADLGEGMAFANFGPTVNSTGLLAQYAIERPLLADAAGNLYTWAFLRHEEDIASVSPAYHNLWRSTDGGATWAALTGVAGVRDLSVGADDSLWAVSADGNAIARSTDHGGTWATIVAGDGYTAGHQPTPAASAWPWLQDWIAIAADPHTAGKVVAMTPEGWADSGNGFGAVGSGVTVWTPFGGYSVTAGGRAIARASGAAATVALTNLADGLHGAGTIDRKPDSSGTVSQLIAGTLTSTGVGLARAGQRLVRLGYGGVAATLWSDIGGGVWTNLLVGGDLPLPTSAAAPANAVAAAADPASGSVYLGLAQGVSPGGGAPAIQTVVAYDFALAAWRDISAAMVAQAGGQYVAYLNGLVAVAGA